MKDPIDRAANILFAVLFLAALYFFVPPWEVEATGQPPASLLGAVDITTQPNSGAAYTIELYFNGFILVNTLEVPAGAPAFTASMASGFDGIHRIRAVRNGGTIIAAEKYDVNIQDGDNIPLSPVFNFPVFITPTPDATATNEPLPFLTPATATNTPDGTVVIPPTSTPPTLVTPTAVPPTSTAAASLYLPDVYKAYIH